MSRRHLQPAQLLSAIMLALAVVAAPVAGQRTDRDASGHSVCALTMKACSANETLPAAAATSKTCCAKHEAAKPTESDEGNPDSNPCGGNGHCSCCVTLCAGGYVLLPVGHGGHLLIEPIVQRLSVTSETAVLPGWCEPLLRPPRA